MACTDKQKTTITVSNSLVDPARKLAFSIEGVKILYRHDHYDSPATNKNK
jgi:hypothetical protein